MVAEEITERKRAEAVLTANDKVLRESEVRFRELADNISQFAWTADANGWIYWYNKRWHDYTGTTLEDMDGWGWQKVHHPEHVDRVVQRIRESFENGTPWEDTFPLRSKDGTYRWFLSRALPIRNEAGGIVRWFGTNTDITQQIEAESALRELNATLEQRVKAETRGRLHIWNVSQDLPVVADLEGKYLSVNPAWTVTLDWSEAELLDRSSQWLLHPDDQEKRMPRYATLPRAERQCVLRAVSAIGMALIDGFLGKPYPTGGDFTPWAGTLQNSKMPRMNCEKPGGNLHSLRDALPRMRCRLQSPMKSNSHLITCDAFKGGRE